MVSQVKLISVVHNQCHNIDPRYVDNDIFRLICTSYHPAVKQDPVVAQNTEHNTAARADRIIEADCGDEPLVIASDRKRQLRPAVDPDALAEFPPTDYKWAA